MVRLIYKIKNYATYGGGPHHCVVCHRDSSGRWDASVEEIDYETAKELFKSANPDKETYKVYKLD